MAEENFQIYGVQITRKYISEVATRGALQATLLKKRPWHWCHCTKNEVSAKDFFSKCDQIRRKLRIWSHLLKKSLMENFIFCEVCFPVSFVKFLKTPFLQNTSGQLLPAFASRKIECIHFYSCQPSKTLP